MGNRSLRKLTPVHSIGFIDRSCFAQNGLIDTRPHHLGRAIAAADRREPGQRRARICHQEAE
jgi:hypothetical protein